MNLNAFTTILLRNIKLKVVIVNSYTSQFSVISVLYSNEKIIPVSIIINNFTLNFNSDSVVKLSPWYCG